MPGWTTLLYEPVYSALAVTRLLSHKLGHLEALHCGVRVHPSFQLGEASTRIEDNLIVLHSQRSYLGSDQVLVEIVHFYDWNDRRAELSLQAVPL